jgi:hypothetical protein
VSHFSNYAKSRNSAIKLCVENMPSVIILSAIIDSVVAPFLAVQMLRRLFSSCSGSKYSKLLFEGHTLNINGAARGHGGAQKLMGLPNYDINESSLHYTLT